MRSLLKKLTQTALPCPCALCGQEQAAVICEACKLAIFNSTQRCQVCAIPLNESQSSHCGRCLHQPPSFLRTYTAGDYIYPAQQLILALKFGRQLPIAEFLAETLAHAYSHQLTPNDRLPDLLLPIPLHPSRFAERGFNQSWEISKKLAKHLNLQASATLLHRIHQHPPQASLSLKDRQKNLRHAFVINDNNKLRDLHIGLVDDVMTTGCTLEEAARTLLRVGVKQVSNFVVLRTPTLF